MSNFVSDTAILLNLFRYRRNYVLFFKLFIHSVLQCTKLNNSTIDNFFLNFFTKISFYHFQGVYLTYNYLFDSMLIALKNANIIKFSCTMSSLLDIHSLNFYINFIQLFNNCVLRFHFLRHQRSAYFFSRLRYNHSLW